MKRLIIAVACTAALGACATPTAFGPARPSARASGFWENRIEPNRYRVSYRGGSGAPSALVQDYALLHAADITVAEGYDWFRIIGRYGEVSDPNGGSGLSVGGGSTSFGRRSATSVGVGFDIPLGGGPQLTETIEILMAKGAKPADADAYGARDVQATLRRRMQGS